MKVGQVNNQPNFGIRYVNKNAWNPNVLKAFEASKLLKGIDAKYPEAAILYTKTVQGDVFGKYPEHTLTAKLQLAKNMVYRWTHSSSKEDAPDIKFLNFIKNATVEEVENKSVTQLTSKLV